MDALGLNFLDLSFKSCRRSNIMTVQIIMNYNFVKSSTNYNKIWFYLGSNMLSIW